MNIELHIERLILDGFSLTRSQGGLVGEAVEAELTRLLAESGLSAGLQTSHNFSRLQATPIQLGNEKAPPQIGQQIALAVFDAIGIGGMSQ